MYILRLVAICACRFCDPSRRCANEPRFALARLLKRSYEPLATGR